MRVTIETKEHGRETVAAVCSARTGRVLHASVGVGVAGAALALVEAYRYAAERGHQVEGVDDVTVLAA